MGRKSVKFLTFENLELYHRTLMEHLQAGKLIPISLCPQCGGVLDNCESVYEKKCSYCDVIYGYDVSLKRIDK